MFMRDFLGLIFCWLVFCILCVGHILYFVCWTHFGILFSILDMYLMVVWTCVF